MSRITIERVSSETKPETTTRGQRALGRLKLVLGLSPAGLVVRGAIGIAKFTGAAAKEALVEDRSNENNDYSDEDY